MSTVQNSAVIFDLCVSKFTPNSAVQGDMGWNTSWHRQKNMCGASMGKINQHECQQANQYNILVYTWFCTHKL